jgi:RNA polymerase sigma-70 factor (ECF subfamily)
MPSRGASIVSLALFKSNPPEDLPIDGSRTHGNRTFVELLGKHEQQLNAFVLALVPSWPDADEIVQQTRIRLWEQFADYDTDKDFGAWARSIAYYQILTYRKQSGRRAAKLSSLALEKLAADVQRTPDLSPRHSALAECLEGLSTQQRDLLARSYSGEESIQQLAATMGRSFTAVRQSLFRLRKVLYRCIEHRLNGKQGG